jgi:hypothetical protein
MTESLFHSTLPFPYLDKRNTYVRMLFIDYSSVFNPNVLSKLITKLSATNTTEGGSPSCSGGGRRRRSISCHRSFFPFRLFLSNCFHLFFVGVLEWGLFKFVLPTGVCAALLLLLRLWLSLSFLFSLSGFCN